MSNRQQLDYDSESLVQNLKASKGQGVNALFSGSSPASHPPDEHSRQPEGSQTHHPYGSTDGRTDVRAAEPATEPTYDDTTSDLWSIPPRPKKRRSERYSFQFWADQIARLKRLNKLLNLIDDGNDESLTSLSDHVRTALDDYLDTKIQELEKTRTELMSTNGRTDARTSVRPDERTDGHTLGSPIDPPAL